jgi:ribonuclease P protein component
MLPSQNRLKKSYEIAKVYKKGVYGGAGVLSVKAAKTSKPNSRVVVIVAKKISKKAVIRNRIRRRVVEFLRTRWGTVTPGYDIVITAHQDISALPATDLETATIKALKRAGVI